MGDIAKAIGVIFVVLGHCWLTAAPYVYTCHLAIFFLMLGYLYNDEKYAGSPFILLASRLKVMLPKYLFYLFIFILLHNDFIDVGIYSQTVPRYPAYSSILLAMVNAVFFNTFEFMAGAMWFIPMLLVGTAIWGCVFYISGKYSFNNPKRKNFILCFSFIILGVLGLFLNHSKSDLLFHAQTSIILMPVAYVGYLMKNHKQILKWVTWYGAIFSIVFIAYILNSTGSMIDLASENIISIYLFYPVTFAGLYISIWLVKLITKCKRLSIILSYIGKSSFDIMALHFLCFKIVDFCYIHISNLPVTEMGKFPISNPALWPLYAFIGIILPVLMVWAYQFMKKQFHNIIDKLLHKPNCDTDCQPKL